MNAPVSPAPRRDPWDGLDPATLVQLYRERGIPAEVGSWGPHLALETTSELAPAGHVLVTYAGKAGEAAWKRLLALHPEASAKAPRWGLAHGGRALLFRQRPTDPALPCALSDSVAVVASGDVLLPGAVDRHELLRFKADAHLAQRDPPELPEWLARATRDDAAREQVRDLLGQVEGTHERARERQEAAVDRAPPPAPPRTSRCFDRGDSVEIAEALLDDLRASAPDAGPDAVVYDRSTFWVYDPTRGIYTERDPAAMCRAVATFAGSPVGPKGRPLALSDGAIKGAVKAASWQVARSGFFEQARQGIAFADCFVTAEAGQVKVLPLSHEHRALHALHVPYEPDREPSAWRAMLREVFRRVTPAEDLDLGPDDAQGSRLDHEDTDACVDLLQEWAGTALLGGATSRAVCLLLVGPGNDGKSSVLNVIRSLFPASAVCSIAPQDWGRSFLAAGLAGKRLNVVSEMPEDDIVSGARFKAVVSGDPITVEHKGRDPFTMGCDAGHIVACNALPPTRDQSAGFWRRFAVIPCERSFAPHEVVRDLWREIVRDELGAVAAWAVAGAARAQTLQAFTTPESARSAKADWQHDTDQVRQCVEECFAVLPRETSSAEESTIADLYAVYRAWCGTAGHTPMARNRLASRLKGLGHEHRRNTARLFRLRPLALWVERAKGLTGHQGGR